MVVVVFVNNTTQQCHSLLFTANWSGNPRLLPSRDDSLADRSLDWVSVPACRSGWLGGHPRTHYTHAGACIGGMSNLIYSISCRFPLMASPGGVDLMMSIWALLLPALLSPDSATTRQCLGPTSLLIKTQFLIL